VQFLFDRQWRRLKAYANAQGVKLVGDMPIYVGGHSADVWANPTLWTLGKDGVAGAVSGTPPDAFSETGQLWGSPLYDWAAHEAEGYRWWASRLGRALALHDEVRIDHFRGLAGYWSVPGDAPTALSGSWKLGPGLAFFNGIKARLGAVPLVAEDLGVITADVVELREAIGAPGMAVLQFGWDGNPKNPHLPHNHYENSFVYPGTHDNETMAGWFAGASATHRANFCAYLGTDGRDPAWDALRMCMMSTAGTVVVAMQDVLRLGNEARMNTPGVAAGNWAWRMGPAGVFSNLVRCVRCACVRRAALLLLRGAKAFRVLARRVCRAGGGGGWLAPHGGAV
jgi:4-alpha-glucanotransferase